MAVAIAKDIAREREQPIGLDLAIRLLPLVAAQQSDAYDWACRSLARWPAEARMPTIDQAADLVAALAEVPIEPREPLEPIRRAYGG
jgi:hypothetical protein